MLTYRAHGASLMLAAAVFTGCADRVTQLSYQPDTRIERVAGGQPSRVGRCGALRVESPKGQP
jgi:hypothetical protein